MELLKRGSLERSLFGRRVRGEAGYREAYRGLCGV
jgi:hypothetical protein